MLMGFVKKVMKVVLLKIFSPNIHHSTPTYYNHPDMLDKLALMAQGGMSKGTKGLNLSEDVYAGMDATLRGHTIVHREYFQVGKGRDMGFLSILGFFCKLSCGTAQMTTSRQAARLGLRLGLGRLLGWYAPTPPFQVVMPLPLDVYAPPLTAGTTATSASTSASCTSTTRPTCPWRSPTSAPPPTPPACCPAPPRRRSHASRCCTARSPRSS